MRRTFKIQGICLISVCLAIVLLSGCMLHPGIFRQDEPDRLSWMYINEEIRRAENWQQYVTDSPFQLGERETIQYDGYPEQIYRFGTYPNLDGSTVAVPMALEFARQHLGMSDMQAADFVAFNTTHGAYENLIYKDERYYNGYYRDRLLDPEQPVDLILVTAPSENEQTIAQRKHVELFMQPVCYDAFVFITHVDNPVDSLTIEQIQKIYSGEITNWKEVGGQNAKITAYQREPDSGSQTGMERLVMDGIPMQQAPKARIVEGMGELIDEVAEYKNRKNSIGYTYQYYIDNLYKNEAIKKIKIDGVSPDAENLKNETYPLTVNYYGVIRAEDREKTGGKFLDWILSDAGQKSVEQAGYIPIK